MDADCQWRYVKVGLVDGTSVTGRSAMLTASEERKLKDGLANFMTRAHSTDGGN